MHTQEWWTTFFHGLAVESWLAFEATPWCATAADVDFLERTLGAPPGSAILDAPCGGGRHAFELAGRGYAVTGLDISAEFLAHARARPAPARGSVELRLGDMRDLPWEQAFDGAYALGNSFAYMDDGGNEAFVRGIARALRPRARFVMETGVVAESILGAFEKRAWYSCADIYSCAERRHDAALGSLVVDYTFLKGSRVEKCRAVYRTYTLREVIGLFERCGLAVEAAWSSQDAQPYATGAPTLYLVARKT